MFDRKIDTYSKQRNYTAGLGWDNFNKPNVIFSLKFKLRANKSFDLSSFLVGNEPRVFEHGGKGGAAKKSERRSTFNYLEKVSAVYVKTTDFANKFLDFTRIQNSRLVLFVTLKGLNHITYHNIQYIDVLVSQ